MTTIKDLQKKIMQNKINHGFNTTDVEFEFLLAYGELAETFDAWHKKKPDLGEELADTMIYVMGIAEILGFDLDKEINAKIAKNAQRTYVKKDGVLLKEGN